MSSAKFQLLLVDDEPLILQSLALLFEDYVVHAAESGIKGLEILKHHPIDVIISDQRMPQMSGVDFLRIAKDISPNSIRILLTGYADLQAVVDSVNVGEIFRYVHKPWNAEKLRETVRFACTVAEQRRAMSIAKAASGAIPALHQPKDDAPSEFELLFVDSNERHLEQFKAFFEPKYRTHVSTKASEAFRLIPNHNIAVVVADSHLNDVDGSDFLIAVRDKFPHVVTVLMTGSQDAKLAIKMINDGQVYRYLVKPFPRETLRLTIESAVIHHKILRENPAANSKTMENALFRNADSTARSIEEMLAALRATIASKPIY
ncbi:MAG: response regulator [Chloroherpetonaceae bacterium]|nr:response regulator [Chloroherpetonaceae bacterium]MDW8438733.1 response regulator [Chloroherpetonaceae bacterium]